MSAKVLPWSHSSLGAFENCPYRYQQERILKVTPKKVFKEASDGINKHAAIENYLKSAGALQLEDPKLKKLVDATLANCDHAYLKFEHKLAVTKDLQPCAWDDAAAYHRGILDVMYVHPEEPVAAIFDWKNGKVNEYSDQLKANAICVMAHYPHVQKVLTEYVWMMHNRTTKGRVFREFIDELWTKFVKRADRLENALLLNVWPKKQSGLCKKYCPVTSCEHNGEYVRG